MAHLSQNRSPGSRNSLPVLQQFPWQNRITGIIFPIIADRLWTPFCGLFWGCVWNGMLNTNIQKSHKNRITGTPTCIYISCRVPTSSDATTLSRRNWEREGRHISQANGSNYITACSRLPYGPGSLRRTINQQTDSDKQILPTTPELPFLRLDSENGGQLYTWVLLLSTWQGPGPVWHEFCRKMGRVPIIVIAGMTINSKICRGPARSRTALLLYWWRAPRRFGEYRQATLKVETLKHKSACARRPVSSEWHSVVSQEGSLVSSKSNKWGSISGNVVDDCWFLAKRWHFRGKCDRLQESAPSRSGNQERVSGGLREPRGDELRCW